MTTMQRPMLSTNFSVADLIEAGETWAELRISNTPVEPGTWAALAELCESILEPVRAEFGHPVITYGFASPALTRKIPGRIFPGLDQHAGHERKPNGEPICTRLGQAVDFRVPGVSSARIAHWVVEHLPFDRLYFYGADRPIHVSVGPENARSIFAMLPGKSGKRVPKNVKKDWLQELAASVTAPGALRRVSSEKTGGKA